MPIEIRPFEGDLRSWTAAVWTAFGGHFDEADLPVFEATHEPERALGAYDGDRPIGTAGIFSFSLTVPGGELPAAGVTTVGVHPTHRRRGILRALMARQLADVRAAGESIAMLWASEGSIYQRFGYGLGTEYLEARKYFERALGIEERALGKEHYGLITRLNYLGRCLKRLGEIDASVGCYTRSAANWEAETFHDPEHIRGGGSPRFYAVHETDGTPNGYLAYRTFGNWGPRGAAGRLALNEILGLSAGAELDLWRYAFDVDLMATTTGWNVPIDSPLLLWLAEPRRLGAMISDALWIRIVDVAAALEGRRYAAEGELTLELTDAFLPDCAGTWTLTTGADGASVARSSRTPDLALDTTDLPAMYLGTFRATRLARAVRVEELREGAVARADALFATDIAPWCSKVF